MIEFIDIGKVINNKIVLKDINLTIPQNSIFGLLGPNGAGKTTIIRLLCQILSPSHGKILIKNKILQDKDIYGIGYLPEERGLYKKMKVEEQLIYFGRLKNLHYLEAKAKVQYWLNKLEVDGLKNKTLQELSKGMQQKIQFIASIVHDPDIIILDEPFSGFDPVTAELLTEILLDLKSQGKTIIFSTHRMETVELLCDHLVLINKGKVVLSGSLNNIKETYKEMIFAVVAEGNIPEKNNLYIIQQIEKISEKSLKFYFKPIEGVETNTILAFLLTKLKIISFSEVRPSIHDIFMREIQGKS